MEKNEKLVQSKKTVLHQKFKKQNNNLTFQKNILYLLITKLEKRSKVNKITLKEKDWLNKVLMNLLKIYLIIQWINECISKRNTLY